jgi:SAM-dependent methyltransferase
MKARTFLPALAAVSLALWWIGGPATLGAAQSPDVHPDIHYVPTPNDVVDAMLTVAHVTGTDMVYDLGSGDGRIVIEAARRFGARGVGVEIDPDLVKRARENAVKAGVSDKVSFVQGDLFKTDFSSATVVTLYLSPSINLRLESKLKRELKPGSRVVSHRFPIGDWAPEQDLTVGGNHVLFWTIR